VAQRKPDDMWGGGKETHLRKGVEGGEEKKKKRKEEKAAAGRGRREGRTNERGIEGENLLKFLFGGNWEKRGGEEVVLPSRQSRFSMTEEGGEMLPLIAYAAQERKEGKKGGRGSRTLSRAVLVVTKGEKMMSLHREGGGGGKKKRRECPPISYEAEGGKTRPRLLRGAKKTASLSLPKKKKRGEGREGRAPGRKRGPSTSAE